MAWLDWSLDKLFSCIIMVILSSPANNNNNNNKINFSFFFFLFWGPEKYYRLPWVWWWWWYYKYTRRRCCYCCFRVQVPGWQRWASRVRHKFHLPCVTISPQSAATRKITRQWRISHLIFTAPWIDIAMKGEKSRSSSVVLADHFDRQLDNKSISF